MLQVLEWCEHHKKDPEPVAEDSDDTRKKTTEISEWDAKCTYICLPWLFLVQVIVSMR